MVRFLTETGSIYEIDEANKQVRRISGQHAPTHRQGEDGCWRTYYSITNLLAWVGGRVLIVWDQVEEEDGQTILQSTLTSVVVRVWYDQ